MISANAYDLKERINEGVRLAHDKGNKSGRLLRRYLDRALMSGMLLQHFALNEHYTDKQLKAIAEYAKTSAAKNEAIRADDVRGAAKAGVYVDTFVDSDSGIVANRYRLVCDINEASVQQLRDMVSYVVDICHELRPFSVNPNSTALQECPDYEYRGLPCSCSETPWMVSGVDIASGAGVLEWCVDQKDAEDRFALMSKHPNRFRHMKVQSWAAMKAAKAA